MKIIAGLDEAFQGEVVWADGYTVGYLSQEPELDESKTVRKSLRRVRRKSWTC